LKTVEFTPPQYARLKETLKLLDYDERKAPILALSAQRGARKAEKTKAADEPEVESNARILESHKELEITDAHSAAYRVRYSKQILNYAGKIREAEVKLDYNPACQQAKLVRGVVTSKTGQRQEIAKDEINVMDAGWNASAKRYTGGKVLVANLPAVDIGSTIEVEFEITSTNKPFLSGFESFQLPDEMEKKSFQVTAPCGVKVERIVTGASGCVKESNKSDKSKQLFEWQVEKVKALPAESQLPPEWCYMPGVEYFAGDVKAYLNDLNDTMVYRSRQGSKAGEKARELTSGAKDKLEAVKAIRDFVAKKIREAGPSFTELPLSELSSADTTLADGYGHAADRAILLHAMLAAAGLEPEFVLGSGLPPIAGITNIAYTFPLPHSFTAPLVRVTVRGTTCYLNDTDQYAKLGSTSHDGKLCFVLSSQNCEVIHAAADSQEKTETVYTMSLDDTGRTRLGVTRRYFGTHYNRKNRFFSELPPEEKSRYYQEMVSGISQGARPVGGLETKFDIYPGIEQFTMEINNYAVADGKYLYFDLPFSPSLFPGGTDHRTLPLFVGGRSDSTIRTEINLPPGFHHMVMSPKVQTLDSPGGSGRGKITAETAGDKYVVAHELEVSPAIVEAKDYSAMLDVESALGKRSSRLFLLEKD
jgi:hypothetical protein